MLIVAAECKRFLTLSVTIVTLSLVSGILDVPPQTSRNPHTHYSATNEKTLVNNVRIQRSKFFKQVSIFLQSISLSISIAICLNLSFCTRYFVAKKISRWLASDRQVFVLAEQTRQRRKRVTRTRSCCSAITTIRRR